MNLYHVFDLDNLPYSIKSNEMVKLPYDTEFIYSTPIKLFKLRLCKVPIYKGVTYYDTLYGYN